jgi:FAD/FMN-containing dehydrogenase
LASLKPQTETDLIDAVQDALAARTPLELIGTGTKRRLGRPMQTAATLDLSGFSGISLYEPEELVITAGAGARLDEIRLLLAASGQEFAFEPPDLSRLLGSDHAGTLGGMLACHLSGPRRLKTGAARDHILGIAGVSGRGEAFKAGGRVVKNVTGYDLPKLMAGSFGTLAALTALTFKGRHPALHCLSPRQAHLHHGGQSPRHAGVRSLACPMDRHPRCPSLCRGARAMCLAPVGAARRWRPRHRRPRARARGALVL